VARKQDPDLPVWPVDEAGQQERGAKLTFAKNSVEVEVQQSLLAAYGIPSIAQLPNQGFFSGVVFGGPLLGATLYVPASRLAEAEELLSAKPDDEQLTIDD
jgi:hypothetical protein